MSVTIKALGNEYEADVAGLLDALGLGPDEIKQMIVNNIDLTTVTQIFVTNYNKAFIDTQTVQDLRVIICDRCTIGGDVIIDQRYTGDLTVFLASNNAFTPSVINELQAEITNQVAQSLNKVETDLAAILGVLSKSTSLDSEVINEMKRVISTTITSQNISEVVAKSFVQQTQEVICRAPVQGNFIVNQRAQQSVIIQALADQAVTASVSDKAVIDWSNEVNQDLQVTRIGPLAIFGIILAVIAVIIVVVLAVYLSASGGIQGALFGQSS